MNSHLSTLVAFLIIILAVYVHSACYQGQVVSQVTKYGTVDTQCLYNDIKVLPGSSFKLAYPDCIECTCTAKSMSCCGFGFHAGKAEGPPGCVAYNDACKLLFVKANNQSKLCAPAKSTASGKKKSKRPRKS